MALTCRVTSEGPELRPPDPPQRGEDEQQKETRARDGRQKWIFLFFLGDRQQWILLTGPNQL